MNLLCVIHSGYKIAVKAAEGLSNGLDGKERLIEIADFIIKRTH